MTVEELVLEADCLTLDDMVKLRGHCQTIIDILESNSEDEDGG